MLPAVCVVSAQSGLRITDQLQITGDRTRHDFVPLFIVKPCTRYYRNDREIVLTHDFVHFSRFMSFKFLGGDALSVREEWAMGVRSPFLMVMHDWCIEVKTHPALTSALL